MRATSPNRCSEHEAYSSRCQAEACGGRRCGHHGEVGSGLACQQPAIGPHAWLRGQMSQRNVLASCCQNTARTHTCVTVS